MSLSPPSSLRLSLFSPLFPSLSLSLSPVRDIAYLLTRMLRNETNKLSLSLPLAVSLFFHFLSLPSSSSLAIFFLSLSGFISLPTIFLPPLSLSVCLCLSVYLHLALYLAFFFLSLVSVSLPSSNSLPFSLPLYHPFPQPDFTRNHTWPWALSFLSPPPNQDAIEDKLDARHFPFLSGGASARPHIAGGPRR